MFLSAGQPHVTPHAILSVLRLSLIGLAVVLPIFLVILLGALLTVLVDFACFRIGFALTGEPRRKSLWEF